MNEYFKPLRKMLAATGATFTMLWIALAAAAVSPARWFNALYYPGLFAIGFAATAVHVALLYDYPIEVKWVLWACVSFLGGAIVLLPLNRLSMFLWGRAVS